MVPLEQGCDIKLIKKYVSEYQFNTRIYGFILYGKEHHYVARALRDEDFWNCLDNISGINWPIFAVRPFNPNERWHYLAPFDRTCLELESIQKIKEDFGIDEYTDLPIFIAFIWDDNDDLLKISIDIDDRGLVTVYHSLEQIVRVISDTVKNINLDYRRDVTVFREVKRALDQLRLRNRLEKFKITRILQVFFESANTWI